MKIIKTLSNKYIKTEYSQLRRRTGHDQFKDWVSYNSIVIGLCFMLVVILICNW